MADRGFLDVDYRQYRLFRFSIKFSLLTVCNHICMNSFTNKLSPLQGRIKARMGFTFYEHWLPL